MKIPISIRTHFGGTKNLFNSKILRLKMWLPQGRPWQRMKFFIFKLRRFSVATSAGCNHFAFSICGSFANMFFDGASFMVFFCIRTIGHAVFMQPSICFPKYMHDAFSGSVTMTLMRENDQPTKSAMTLQCVEKPV